MKAILANKYMGNLLVAIDQFGNAIAGGYADSTVSGRVGYYSYKKYTTRKWRNKYWKTLRAVIDWAFYPLDGPEHCRKAYQFELDEKHAHGSDLALAALGIIVLVFAPVLGVINRI
jgi:hypothetical protein